MKSKTKAEKLHLQKVADIGCIVCRNCGRFGVPAEVHHIRNGAGIGQRNSHFETIPLCPAHHRTGGVGIAFHAAPRTFEAAYGTERELLAQVNELLGVNG